MATNNSTRARLVLKGTSRTHMPSYTPVTTITAVLYSQAVQVRGQQRSYGQTRASCARHSPNETSGAHDSTACCGARRALEVGEELTHRKFTITAFCGEKKIVSCCLYQVQILCIVILLLCQMKRVCSTRLLVGLRLQAAAKSNTVSIQAPRKY